MISAREACRRIYAACRALKGVECSETTFVSDQLRRAGSISQLISAPTVETTLAERLVAVRQHWRLSQKNMAARCGLGSSSWQRYERTSTPPNSKVLTALAGEGVNINWLLTGDGDMFREGRS